MYTFATSGTAGDTYTWKIEPTGDSYDDLYNPQTCLSSSSPGDPGAVRMVTAWPKELPPAVRSGASVDRDRPNRQEWFPRAQPPAPPDQRLFRGQVRQGRRLGFPLRRARRPARRESARRGNHRILDEAPVVSDGHQRRPPDGGAAVFLRLAIARALRDAAGLPELQHRPRQGRGEVLGF